MAGVHVFRCFSALLVSLFVFVASVFAEDMPAPFYRELAVSAPYLTGNDVLIAQTLLLRDSEVPDTLATDGVYGPESAKAVSAFQEAHDMKATGVLDAESAQVLLDLHEEDGYKDSGFTAASMGYLYKVHIPVHKNRSIETKATLFDKDNNVVMTFTARTHGKRGDGTSSAWPDFGDGDIGLTQLASSGNTVTGLVEIDLNSPEPSPDVYGPWPVNRIVRGLDGNALLLLPNIRDGILIHTGNWTTDEVDWNPTMDMPNSSGCIHGHPSDVERIYQELVKLGVTVNDNTYSGKNYPYQPQGVGVFELVDEP